MRSTHSVASWKNLDYCLCGFFLDFRSGGRNRCRRTMLSCFGLRLGKDNSWIRCVKKAGTTTAYLHCHLDSFSSVRMLWSAEMTCAKTVATKCTVISGIRLTIVFVTLHTSQFGSFETCANTSCSLVGLLEFDLLDVSVRTS